MTSKEQYPQRSFGRPLEYFDTRAVPWLIAEELLQCTSCTSFCFIATSQEGEVRVRYGTLHFGFLEQGLAS